MFFSHVIEAPADPIFGLSAAFKEDPRSEKINLLIGSYKNEHLEGELMSVVQQAQREVQDRLADYLPIDGYQKFVQKLGPVVFGSDLWERSSESIYGAQTLGAAGALRAGAELLVQQSIKAVYIPNYTWPGHFMIFQSGGLEVLKYPYYSSEQQGFDLLSMVKGLKAMPSRSAVVLHASCHNPTGADPNEEDWKTIAEVMQEKELLPFFDVCYQGFGKSLEKDVFSLRYFLNQGFEMLISYSCSKNMSLYCQRVGALFIAGSPSSKKKIASQIKQKIRSLYSNPPAHGAFLAHHVISKLFKEWSVELSRMKDRLEKTRKEFVSLLEVRSGRDYSTLYAQRGMFAFLNLDASQTNRLKEEFGIYLAQEGRMNLAGLNRKNIEQVVDSVVRVIE